ncbi:14284_t:CDS:2, partial [Acaulospora colombiana]
MAETAHGQGKIITLNDYICNTVNKRVRKKWYEWGATVVFRGERDVARTYIAPDGSGVLDIAVPDDIVDEKDEVPQKSPEYKDEAGRAKRARERPQATVCAIWRIADVSKVQEVGGELYSGEVEGGRECQSRVENNPVALL